MGGESGWRAVLALLVGFFLSHLTEAQEGLLFVYKRYFDQQDLSGWANKYGVTISIEYFGTAFFALSGRFMYGISARNA